MRSSVLRISSSRSDLEKLFPDFEVHLNNGGANVCLCEEDDPVKHEEHLLDFVVTHQATIKGLLANGGSAELDIAIGVGSPEQFTSSVIFQPAFLARISELGLDLRVSGYPLLDDE